MKEYLCLDSLGCTIVHGLKGWTCKKTGQESTWPLWKTPVGKDFRKNKNAQNCSIYQADKAAKLINKSK